MSFDTFLENWKPPVQESKPIQEPVVFKTGDILLCNWGYEANNPHFFKVIKRTEKQLVINQLINQTVSYTNDGLGGQMVIPTDQVSTWSVWRDNNSDEHKPVVLRRKIQKNTDGDECVAIASYAWAFKWKGQPAHDYNWH